ncbi:endonuclease III [Marispirochaeta aestuarii]|uniref:Endonuclease III n=1 Tax=Marispirochaeta aestuarii TaxID=1963862 RepID=A0A1Y1RXA6_9SPIO|nr:endonuclease III [Marispirochaeta aestuarii]
MKLPWKQIISVLRRATGATEVPSVTKIAGDGPDPYRVLISTIISLRTRDEVTISASERLFSAADTPSAMLRLSSPAVADLIYPAGFYRTKADTILKISGILLEAHDGKVPSRLTDLLTLPGVGRKTANLTLGLAFGIPSICVDTHVHRIPNRAGWISTSNPEQTEDALMQILPEEFWIEINTLLVAFGKDTCTPVSPWCSRCPISNWCSRIGVSRHR